LNPGLYCILRITELIEELFDKIVSSNIMSHQFSETLKHINQSILTSSYLRNLSEDDMKEMISNLEAQKNKE